MEMPDRMRRIKNGGYIDYLLVLRGDELNVPSAGLGMPIAVAQGDGYISDAILRKTPASFSTLNKRLFPMNSQGVRNDAWPLSANDRAQTIIGRNDRHFRCQLFRRATEPAKDRIAAQTLTWSAISSQHGLRRSSPCDPSGISPRGR